MSYSSAMATAGVAETIRPRPATGMIARSTSAISSLVAPAASARAALHCRQTSDDPMATDTATCSSAIVLASSPGVPSMVRPNPAPTSPSSKIASLRRVSWYLAVRLMSLRCRAHQPTSRHGKLHHPNGGKDRLPRIVGCAVDLVGISWFVRVKCARWWPGSAARPGSPAEVPMAVHAAKQVVTNSRRPVASAGDPILESKITPPGVPGWAIQRPRITKMIAEGTRWCPVTVLTGPVGVGKTIALALWTAAEPGPVAWVCLDEYNSRPGAFWSYVVAAVQRSGVAVSGVLPGASRGRPAENLFLLRLASALAAQDPPVTLILDDLHLITEPKILNGLDFLVRSVGSSLRFVASARADPALPMHRYRLTGKLADIQGDR